MRDGNLAKLKIIKRKNRVLLLVRKDPAFWPPAENQVSSTETLKVEPALCTISRVATDYDSMGFEGRLEKNIYQVNCCAPII